MARSPPVRPRGCHRARVSPPSGSVTGGLQRCASPARSLPLPRFPRSALAKKGSSCWARHSSHERADKRERERHKESPWGGLIGVLPGLPHDAVGILGSLHGCATTVAAAVILHGLGLDELGTCA